MTSSSHRVIVHVDMNSYFASVEQKTNPALLGKPVVVVGDLKRRSIVLTASYEARAYGIKTGDLFWDAKRRCPQVVPVIADHHKYTAQTEEIVAILEQYSSQVEMTSIDEGFLDVTGSLGLFKTDGAGLARMIQKRIKDELQLPCSVGVAPNKLLAKLASGMKKPMGVVVIRPEAVRDTLADLPVEELSGIGPHLRASLNQMGIRTCGQLAAVPLEMLRAKFGVVGQWLRQSAQGEDDSPVKNSGEQDDAKSVGHSTTLPADTADRKVIESFILLLAEKVGIRLRKGRLLGRTITTTVRYSDFTTASKSHSVIEPVDDGLAISRIALKIFDQMDEGRPVRLLGVTVSNLAPADGAQFLFESLEKGRKVSRAMDEINEKFGKGKIRRAKVLEAEKFGVLESLPSPQKPRFS
jgi:DNA polymerase-4